MTQTVPVRVGDVEVLLEVVSVAGSQQTSAAGRATDYVADAFERALSTVEEIAVSTARTVGRIGRRVGSPELVEVEFGVKVSAKGDVIVAGASGEASLKVKIVYGSAGRAEEAPERDQAVSEAEPDGSGGSSL
ncbi:CU044_2847 family protein [Micromonospora sp. NPDC049204]|uniref:CU044_2847 family protein n=1 Tax=Micromonospora sp. NPDC049204 TaxID=3154351 RepID=UPI00340DB7E0